MRSIPVLLAALLAGPALAQPFHAVGPLDDLESYNTGALGGQGLWFSGGLVSFVDATFLDPAFGDRTLSVRVSSSTDIAVKLFDVPPAYGRLDFDVLIGDIGMGTVELIEGASNRVVAFLEFRSTDDIHVLNKGGFGTTPTGTQYTPNVTNRIGMEVLPGNVANYYLDGELFYVHEDLSDFEGNPSIGYNEFEVNNIQFNTSSIYIDNLEFVEPAPPVCTPDVNDDGVLDNGDIGAFIGLYIAGDAAADFNGDGFLDNGDIITFVSLFLAGC